MADNHSTPETRELEAPRSETARPEGAPTEAPPSEAVSAEAASTDDASSLRTVRHWPLKLQLAPVDDVLLHKAPLLICGDCTAFATRGFHDRAADGKAMLIGCPKFEDPRLLKMKMVELFQTAHSPSCSVVRMEKPCCKGLVTVCAEAAKECGMPFEVQEIIVFCSGELEGA